MKTFPIRRPLRALDVPASGARVTVAADEVDRAAFADFLGVSAVPAFSADFEITQWRRDGLRVRGAVTGSVEQPCVVTLEPVVQAIDEPVDVRLAPEGGPGRSRAASADATFDPLGPDPPEHFDGIEVDLGAIAAEHFALAIDPYPRLAGASLAETGDAPAVPATPAEEGAAKASPFAALSQLKRDLED